MIKAHQIFDLFGKKTFEKAVIRPPFRMIAQMPDEACFYYIQNGRAKVFTPTQEIIAEPTEGFVLRCGTYINDFLESADVEYCEAIAVHFYPEVLKLVYDKEFPDFLTKSSAMPPARYDRVKASELLRNYIDSLQFYFDNPELISDELLKLKLKECILLLAKTDNADAIRAMIAGMFSPAEIEIKNIIEANLFNNLGLEELAALANMSLSSFKREFVKSYDTSPAKYIRQKKLEKAAGLLVATDSRISDIAFDCGFIDLAHFSRTFQKAYEATPSEYRLNQKNNSLNRIP